MAVAGVVDVLVNPNNTAQRYIFFGNGRIDAIGGAVPVTGQGTWYSSLDQPIVVAGHITDWATGAGYQLDLYGGTHEFNGAPDITSTFSQAVPYSSPTRLYVDWSWSTAGNGQGYVLDQYGQLYPFGGASGTRAGRLWTWPAARRLVMTWSPTKRGIIMDLYGGLHDEFTTMTFTGGAYFKGKDFARDVVITAWSATPAGYLLDLYGGVHNIGAATDIAGSAIPYRPGADVARKLEVVTTSPLRLWEVWSGGQQWEVVSSTPPTVNAGAGTSEQQTITITGAPTAGTYTLTFNAQTTATIAWNATATTVQTALRALSGIGSTGVTVTGGPGPGTPWVVTFAGNLAYTDVAQMTATSSLTGGTAPAVTVTTTLGGESASPAKTVTTTTRPTLAWTYSDPQQDAQAAYRAMVFTETFAAGHTMTDPTIWAASALLDESGTDPTVRGVDPDVDFANGQYRLYVQATDSSGKASAWSSWSWTQNIATPATPTSLSATANQTTYSVALSVSATTGGSANLIRFECSDDAGVTWQTVRGAGAVTLAATTTATDWDPPLGVTRQYRAVAYATNPRVASNASSTATATVTGGKYVLRAVSDTTLGGLVSVQDPSEWSRPVAAGVFEGIGAEFPTVVKDGTPKARRAMLHVLTETRVEWDRIEALLETGSTLVYRDPFGEVIYCEVVGDWARRQLLASPRFGEVTPLGHVHTTDLPLVEVKPPLDA